MSDVTAKAGLNSAASDSAEFEDLVQKVLHAVALAMAAQKPDQYLLTVFTGGTAGFSQALSGLESLMLNGMKLRVVMSESAGFMYGDVVENKILSWPNACTMETGNWFAQVQKCTGVVVPMLSVASLSRVVTLAPDTLATNIILQALFMGKPVVAAIDGAAPGSADRAVLGLDQGTSALNAALARRLIDLSDFGARLTLSPDLGPVTLNAVEEKNVPVTGNISPAASSVVAVSGGNKAVSVPRRANALLRVVDASHVRVAKSTGGIITAAPGAIITPLAFELAKEWGIKIR